MKKISKTFKTILIALIYPAIYYAVSTAVGLVYMLWQESLGRASVSEIVLNATDNSYALNVIAMIITFWIYLIIGRVRGICYDEVIENRKNPPIIYAMTVCLAIGLRLLVSVYYAYSQNVEVLKRSIDEASAMTPNLTGTTQLMTALFAIAVVTPFFEEMLFRGIIMHDFMKIMRPWAAILLQAILFGVAHGVLFQSLFTFVIGVILGIVYYRTQNLKTVALCHGAFNISVILAQSELTLRTGIMVTAMGMVLVVFSMIYIMTYCKRQ